MKRILEGHPGLALGSAFAFVFASCGGEFTRSQPGAPAAAGNGGGPGDAASDSSGASGRGGSSGGTGGSSGAGGPSGAAGASASSGTASGGSPSDGAQGASGTSAGADATDDGSGTQTDPERDWNARTQAPGVVWFHDFRNAAEVANFRWAGGIGDDPLNMGDGSVRQVQDGPTGYALEIQTAAGTEAQQVWWRMMAPLKGSANGRGRDDPGMGGKIAPKDYAPAPSNGDSRINGWSQTASLYGHPEHASTGQFDGSEYYLQMRVKISASRYDPANAGVYLGGNLVNLAHTFRSSPRQAIVTQNRVDKIFGVFRAAGQPLEPSRQFGSELAHEWSWPPGKWVTLLYHVVPGREGVPETSFQVWSAEEGVKTYTKIWDTRQVPLSYDFGKGQNAITLSSFMNGDKWPVAASVHFTQLIFSQQTIACPQS